MLLYARVITINIMLLYAREIILNVMLLSITKGDMNINVIIWNRHGKIYKGININAMLLYRREIIINIMLLSITKGDMQIRIPYYPRLDKNVGFWFVFWFVRTKPMHLAYSYVKSRGVFMLLCMSNLNLKALFIPHGEGRTTFLRKKYEKCPREYKKKQKTMQKYWDI